ncbi:MAG: hypothetical protein IPK16_32190 [Anaerolineales bacterium]|nr:hypothetical protein [Anaerolineales bacterium]
MEVTSMVVAPFALMRSKATVVVAPDVEAMTWCAPAVPLAVMLALAASAAMVAVVVIG